MEVPPVRKEPAIRSLEQKLILFLLVPVGLLLFLTGFLGFMYARGVMFREWRDASILRLERAAHHLDMRLAQPFEWVQMFYKTAEGRGGYFVQEWLLDQLRTMEGVTNVDLQWPQDFPQSPGMGMRSRGDRRGAMMRFHAARVAEVTPPHMDAESGKKTVDLVSELKDESGSVIGLLRISLSFDHLMQDILELGWSEGDQACLVDDSGRYLAHTFEMAGRSGLGQNGDPLESEILRDMKTRRFGTVLGPGYPPKMVGGFYRISKAPWTLIVFAPGETILAPIIRFRTYYFLAGLGCIAMILALIRLVAVGLAHSVRELSTAAERIAEGEYGKPLESRRSDELGTLIVSFNKMVEGLKERDFISNTFGRYMDQEIAKEILQKPEAGRLGGEKRWVSILMSDIRGFTDLSNSLQPETTIKVLNRYFAHLIASVQQYKGIIVDFFGDGILVFFDPLDRPLPPSIRNAVGCALDMQAGMNHFNSGMKADGLPELQMGIGVNAGEVVVGNIGSEYRAKYGIVGSAVNITERIQSLAKAGEVVVSETVHSLLSGELIVQSSFTSQLRGIQGETKLFVAEGIRHYEQHT